VAQAAFANAKGNRAARGAPLGAPAIIFFACNPRR
jgi:hypothetical protein